MGCVPLHMGLCLGEVPAVKSLSHGDAVPAPFGKGALRAVPAANFARWLSTIRYFPDPPGIVTAVRGWESIPGKKGTMPAAWGCRHWFLHFLALGGNFHQALGKECLRGHGP